jgi:deoxyribonuclease-4
MKLLIGSHVSFKKEEQLLGSVKEAISYGENTFMFYTGAPQNSNRYPIDEKFVKEAHKLMSENNININDVVVHAPYIINLANKDENIKSFAISFLIEEIKRCNQLGINKIVVHPGSHVQKGVEMGINNTIDALNKVLNDDSKVIICLETMAGKGSEIGFSFEQLKEIIDNVKHNDRLMICLDTCHIHDAGYDLSNFDSILDEIDKLIGIKKIGCIHVNDSKNLVGDKKDRHANIGFGDIGFDKLINIIYNKRIENVPKILETPYITDGDNSYPPYKFEIEMIRNKVFDKDLIERIKHYYN